MIHLPVQIMSCKTEIMLAWTRTSSLTLLSVKSNQGTFTPVGAQEGSMEPI